MITAVTAIATVTTVGGAVVILGILVPGICAKVSGGARDSVGDTAVTPVTTFVFHIYRATTTHFAVTFKICISLEINLLATTVAAIATVAAIKYICLFLTIAAGSAVAIHVDCAGGVVLKSYIPSKYNSLITTVTTVTTTARAYGGDGVVCPTVLTIATNTFHVDGSIYKSYI